MDAALLIARQASMLTITDLDGSARIFTEESDRYNGYAGALSQLADVLDGSAVARGAALAQVPSDT